jgi:chemotaxis signal transduction protein
VDGIQCSAGADGDRRGRHRDVIRHLPSMSSVLAGVADLRDALIARIAQACRATTRPATLGVRRLDVPVVARERSSAVVPTSSGG